MSTLDHEDKCKFYNGFHWHKYNYLESKVLELSNYITIDENNFCSYSKECADLLVLIGNEVDTFFGDMIECPKVTNFIDESKSLKFQKRYNIKNYRDIFEPLYELSKNKIDAQYGYGNQFSITPFIKFDEKSPCWWDAYNGIKHDYFTDFHKANLRNVLNCLAGLFILNALHSCSKKYLIENKLIKLPYKRKRVVFDEVFEPSPNIEEIMKSNIGTNLFEPDLIFRTNLFDFKYRVDKKNSANKYLKN